MKIGSFGCAKLENYKQTLVVAHVCEIPSLKTHPSRLIYRPPCRAIPRRWPTNGIHGGKTVGSRGSSFRPDTYRNAITTVSSPTTAAVQFGDKLSRLSTAILLQCV